MSDIWLRRKAGATIFAIFPCRRSFYCLPIHARRPRHAFMRAHASPQCRPLKNNPMPVQDG